MENQAKVIVIERNKFASLVKSHRKCLQMQRQKGYIRFTTQKGMTVYEITDLLRLENMLEMGSVYRKIDKKVMNLEPLHNE